MGRWEGGYRKSDRFVIVPFSFFAEPVLNFMWYQIWICVIRLRHTLYAIAHVTHSTCKCVIWFLKEKGGKYTVCYSAARRGLKSVSELTDFVSRQGRLHSTAPHPPPPLPHMQPMLHNPPPPPTDPTPPPHPLPPLPRAPYTGLIWKDLLFYIIVVY